jgi:hypothetical protein
MYRDEPLDDEAELREIIGDSAVDTLLVARGAQGVAVALDALRLLQGWVEQAQIVTWFTGAQQRLGGRTPHAALVAGDDDEVEDALRAYLAAQS